MKKRKEMKNEGSTTTGTPTSYVSNTLHCHYSLTLPQTRTHARTNTLTKNIRFYNNNRQRCLFLSFTHNNDNNNNQITHREKENRIRWIDRFYDIFMILLFYLLYFELFISDWLRDVYELDLCHCEFPFRIYVLHHTDWVMYSVCWVVLYCICACMLTVNSFAIVYDYHVLFGLFKAI